MKVKFTADFVKKMFEDANCVLLSEFVNGRSSVDYICSCGEKAKIKPYAFSAGSRCEKCRRKKTAKAKSHNLDYVKQFFQDQGCELLGEYVTAATPVQYRCVCGAISKIAFDSFKRGNRCKQCGISKTTGENHYRWQSDRELVSINKKIKVRMRNNLRRLYETLGLTKVCKSETLLGYTAADLHERLKSYPEWKELQNEVWHIDHIFPIQAFLNLGIFDISLINHLDNLRPMSAKQNLVKNDRYCQIEFHSWLNQHGWFQCGKDFQKLDVVAQGVEVFFYIPTQKIFLVEKSLKEKFACHTIESRSAFGIWNTIEDINTKLMTCVPKNSLGDLLKFISGMCGELEEDAIYVSIESKGFLVGTNHG
jgi:hypothetical protein